MMAKNATPMDNPENDRLKRDYYRFLEGAKGLSVLTVDNAARSIDRYEAFTDYRAFWRLNTNQILAFKLDLSTSKNIYTKKELSKATQRTILLASKAFFQWLSQEPQFKARMNHRDVEYFNMREKDNRIANTRREKRVPSTDQIEALLAAMPFKDQYQKRDRAVIAFAYLTGARVSAMASAKLKHVDLAEELFFQDAREVDTKFSKTISTWFFPVASIALESVTDWILFLRNSLHYSGDDPLFPSNQMAGSRAGKFVSDGLSRRPWANSSSIRKIFKEAFWSVGQPYYNPHVFRNVLVLLGERHCRTVEEFKAWSQNLGHSKVMVTLQSYGTVPPDRARELMRGLKHRPLATEAALDQIQRALDLVRSAGRR